MKSGKMAEGIDLDQVDLSDKASDEVSDDDITKALNLSIELDKRQMPQVERAIGLLSEAKEVKNVLEAVVRKGRATRPRNRASRQRGRATHQSDRAAS